VDDAVRIGGVDRPIAVRTAALVSTRRRLALIALVGTGVVVTLDVTMINLALHAIGNDLGARGSVTWVLTVNLLSTCIGQPLSSWTADRYGSRRILLTSLAAFAAASLGCALSPSFAMLLIARGVQGLAGGALIPVGLTTLVELFPRTRQGRAMALWGMSSVITPSIGPLLGGSIATHLSWRWMFVLLASLAVVALLVSFVAVPTRPLRPRPCDLVGIALGTSGLGILLVGLSRAEPWGWASVPTLACIGAGLVLLHLFVRHESRAENPVVLTRIFAIPQFRGAIAVLCLVFIAQYTRLIFLPLELQEVRRYTPLRIGVLFVPAGLATAVSTPLGGLLTDRIGTRRPMIAGCSVMLMSTLGFAAISVDTSDLAIVLLLCLQGVGSGIALAPTMTAGLSDLPPEILPNGAAIRALMGHLCGIAAAAGIGAVVAVSSRGAIGDSAIQHAYGNAFLVAAAGLLVALVVAWRMPARDGAPA
jgi:EmrB/QacA subfamily drug resistance transporter